MAEQSLNPATRRPATLTDITEIRGGSTSQLRQKKTNPGR